MSRAPWVLQKPSRPYPAGNETLHSTTLGWRLVNPRMPGQWTIALGESAEILANRYEISSEEQDTFAARSHQLAAAAWDAGVYAGELIPVPGTALTRDEGIRPDASVESLATLKPAFRPNGTVTAGNSSPLTDGASTLLLGSEDAISAEPLARITGRAATGNDPDIFGIAPVEAANRALARAGRTWADVDLVELNEAFAAQSLACLQLWPELDPEKVNIHGGAIAVGRPLGACGGRIIGHVAHELARRGNGIGIAAICIGVGQGLAVVMER
jgi:acetyl-CoA acetyltransferase family protein